MKQKKGLLKIFGIVLGFSFLLLMILFMTMFVKDIGKTEFLDKIDNITTDIEDDVGLSAEMKTHIHSIPGEYEALVVPYDLYFLVSILLMFITSLGLSYKSKEQNIFTFFGSLTFGLIGLLFFTGFITVINDWFILNFINGFLEFDLNVTPIINYYINNLGWINLLWGSILIGINKLNFSNTREDNLLDGDFEQ